MKDDNKLIAEFMGGQRVLPDEDVYNMPTHNNLCYGVNELQYDTSWDWLMPVIKKCLVGEAEMNEEISNTTIKNIYEGICNQDISQAYKSVVRFIKEYNK